MTLPRRDQRDGYKFTQSVKSAGNYYPLVTGILIKVRASGRKRIAQDDVSMLFQDDKQDLQLTVVTDRAEGGGSIQDGAVEIMVRDQRSSCFDIDFLQKEMNLTAYGSITDSVSCIDSPTCLNR
jgi:hypothetical protein